MTSETGLSALALTRLRRLELAAYWLLAAVVVLALASAVELDRDAQERNWAPAQSRTASVSIADLARTQGDRFSIYVALHDFAPGARVVVDPAVRGVEELYFVGIGDAREVSFEQHEVTSVAEGASLTEQGTLRFRDVPWSLWLNDPGVGEVFIWESDGEVWLSDGESGSEGSELAAGSRGSGRVGRSVIRDGLTDGLLAGALLVGGALSLRRTRMSEPLRCAIGLIVGLSVLGVLGLARLAAPLHLLLTGAALAGLGVVGSRVGTSRSSSRISMGPLIGSVTILVVVATFSRGWGFISVTPDSFRYLAGGVALSSGELTLSMLDPKHMIAQQAFHAPSAALGVEGFQSMGAMVLLAGLVVLWNFSRDVLQTFGEVPAKILAWSLVVVFATSVQVLRMASYINSHLVFGVTLLCAGYLWYSSALEQSEDRRTALVCGALLSSLVLLRPEGIFLVGVMFVAAVSVQRRKGEPMPWASAWIAAGVVSACWQALLLASHPGIPLAAGALLILSTIMVIVAATSQRIPRAFASWPARFLYWAGLLGTGVIYLTASDEVTFFDSIEQNIFLGSGGWGILGIAGALLLVAVVSVGGLRRVSDQILVVVWPVALYIPIVLIAKLGDGVESAALSVEALSQMLATGGGREGWGDSVNRMWTHIAFLLPVSFLLVARELAGAITVHSEPSARWRGWLALLTVSTSMLVVSGFWDPQYLGSRFLSMASMAIAMLCVAGLFTSASHRPRPSGAGRDCSSRTSVSCDSAEAMPGGSAHKSM